MVCNNSAVNPPVKFARVLLALVISWMLPAPARAASLGVPDEFGFDLDPPAASSSTNPGGITLGLPPSGDTTVSWFNNSSTLLRDSANAPLSQGLAGTNQDGALVQLGYFTSGTAANNFAGTFIPLTIGTRIGDSANLSGEGAGRIGFQAFFSSDTNVVNIYDMGLDAGAYATTSFDIITASTPLANQVLAIRFFDTTNGASGFFNTVSADTWLWQSPTPLGATVVIDFANSALEWQDTANPFRTLIPIPEPSSAAIVLVSGLLSCAMRRRRA